MACLLRELKTPQPPLPASAPRNVLVSPLTAKITTSLTVDPLTRDINSCQDLRGKRAGVGEQRRGDLLAIREDGTSDTFVRNRFGASGE